MWRGTPEKRRAGAILYIDEAELADGGRGMRWYIQRGCQQLRGKAAAAAAVLRISGLQRDASLAIAETRRRANK